MKFSLIIPCYNEADSLPLLLERCRKVTHTPDIEIILVDNGSTDRTPEVLTSLLPHYPGCRSIRVDKNQGYGFGIISGLKAATGDILGWTHADMQTDPFDIVAGLSLFSKNGQNIFVKGQRHGRPLGDVFFTIGMSVFEVILLRTALWDINAQPTLFSRDFFNRWHEPPHDFSLDLYAYYLARRNKIKVFRFPVKFGQRAHGLSHWNVDWMAKYKFIKRTISYSLQLVKTLKI